MQVAEKVEQPVSPQIERIVEQSIEKVPVAAPSKVTLVKEWFEAHPEDLKKTIRELASIQLPFGLKANKDTWNKVRKTLT